MDGIGTTSDREEQLDPLEAPLHPPADAPGSAGSDPLPTAARLLLGTATLGMEALGSRLRAWGRQPDVGAVTTVSSGAPRTGSAADVVVALAARGVRTAASVGGRGVDLAARGMRRSGRGTDALAKLLPDFLDEPLGRARERARERIQRLGAAGRDELDRSRAVARAALDDGIDAVIGRLAESRELQLVIRTQSVTAGEEAVDSIRNQTARIDDRLEGAARKLLRRRPRPPAAPPR